MSWLLPKGIGFVMTVHLNLHSIDLIAKHKWFPDFIFFGPKDIADSSLKVR
jgi:hypothetical protein